MRTRRAILTLTVVALLVALGVIVRLVAGGGQSPTAGGGGGASSQQLAALARARANLPAARAALNAFRAPAAMHPVSSHCQPGWHCYVVDRPSSRAAPLLPAILTRLGVDPSPRAELPALARAEGLPASGQSATFLESLGASHGPVKVAGCTSKQVSGQGLVTVCRRSVAIDDNVVSVYLAPDALCPTSPARCRLSKSRIAISAPSGAPSQS